MPQKYWWIAYEEERERESRDETPVARVIFPEIPSAPVFPVWKHHSRGFFFRAGRERKSVVHWLRMFYVGEIAAVNSWLLCSSSKSGKSGIIPRAWSIILKYSLANNEVSWMSRRKCPNFRIFSKFGMIPFCSFFSRPFLRHSDHAS